jgi:hypothetical protein
VARRVAARTDAQERRPADDRRPTTDDRRPTTDDRRPTTDDRRPSVSHDRSAWAELSRKSFWQRRTSQG